MLDNLQEAYTSYQQALYHLRDPKVSFPAFVIFESNMLYRNPSYGTESVFSTIAMAPSIMPKKLFRK